MTFLPEDDTEYLQRKGIPYEQKTEKLPDGNVRNGILFPGFQFMGKLRVLVDTQWADCSVCDLLILIPSGYATTKLDSFYTKPFLKRQDGGDPQNANGEQDLFGSKWQFWSRHLTDDQWRADIDGLETYLQYVRDELRKA